MLVKKEEDGKERLVYFISRTLKDYKTRYTPIEKLCQCIMFSTKRLRHYMINSIIHVLTQVDPLRYLMSKPCLNGRSTKWVMLLQEFDLNFVKQKSIKGQVVTYFIVEFPMEDSKKLREEFHDECAFTKMIDCTGEDCPQYSYEGNKTIDVPFLRDLKP